MIANPPTLSSNNDAVHISDELRDYFLNKFRSGATLGHQPSVNEPYIDSWQGYTATFQPEEAFQLLKVCYPQFNFPIQEGINKTQEYIDVVLKGKPFPEADRVVPILSKPEKVTFSMYESVAGKVPVLTVADDEDFVKVVQCFLYKNNPTVVPKSMGALLVNGVNNWDRIRALKAKWVRDNPSESWNHEFSKSVLPNPGLYKDKLVVLSTKPYSAVNASRLGLTETEWLALSLTIRLEHECAHLYTLNHYSCASNNLHDELVADYIGISKTVGDYRKEWILAFMGLEEYPNYRKGARLENYLNGTTLTSGNFRELISVIKSAIENISEFDRELGRINSEQDQLSRMSALCTVDLLDISSYQGSKLLIEEYNRSISKHS